MSESKRTDDELLTMLSRCPRLGSIWVHYRSGNLYLVVGSAIAEATQEPLVIYHRQANSLMFALPLREWGEEVADEHGSMVPRFRPRTVQ